jgi:hypothetical protein
MRLLIVFSRDTTKNPKSGTNSKFKIGLKVPLDFGLEFCALDLFRISDFEFRICYSAFPLPLSGFFLCSRSVFHRR